MRKFKKIWYAVWTFPTFPTHFLTCDGEDGVKRSKKANGCLIDGLEYKEK